MCGVVKWVRRLNLFTQVPFRLMLAWVCCKFWELFCHGERIRGMANYDFAFFFMGKQ